eukprot:CAMPEP_0198492820 /NCGR_PEP_ID=MMETSP1462-20131121/3630_1 /TAXON_ID=1333877 /ORGANISM="Brandtodinium nutriculum, Strain RCC3387" /LENGTH=49 /DNA_ID= /DNA_START= /DNA_END= /DNA_ORIENTATION=
MPLQPHSLEGMHAPYVSTRELRARAKQKRRSSIAVGIGLEGASLRHADV